MEQPSLEENQLGIAADYQKSMKKVLFSSVFIGFLDEWRVAARTSQYNTASPKKE